MRDLPDHAKGLLVTGAGAVLLSPDSLLVRLIATDQWTMVFWRTALLALSLGVVLALTQRRRLVAGFRAVGRAGLAIACLFTLSTILFITALEHTSVANTLIIASSAPLFAAVFSWIFLGEAVAPRTWGAILGALAGIAVIVSGAPGRGALVGDLAALGTALCVAMSLAIIRRTRARALVPTMALSGLIGALITLPLATPLALDATQAGLMALLGLVVLPASFVLALLGPRYLPAPEAGLLLLLETVLGPFWVWLVLGEDPGPRALIGGAVVIGTLIVHSILALRGQPVPRDPPAVNRT